MDREEGEDWVPLRARPAWADVVPIPQDDGPRPVVPIAYTDQFREVMDYFRAILAKDERSSRSLELTAEVIALNSANYTVWHFRRLVLEALRSNLEEELDFIESVAENNFKNYQIWHHRRWVAQKLGVGAVSGELEFTEIVLLDDAKNYHAWSHRQWVLQELGGWEGELDFCSRLLEKDVYNNSAWNQRYFVVTKSPLIGGLQAMREREVHYCVDAIKAAPMNESPWRYLRGLFKGDQDALVHNPLVVAACIEEIRKDASCVQALSLLVDLLGAGFEPTPSDTELLHQPVSSPADLASNVCTHLENVDAMRARYWAWRRSLLPSTTPVS